MLLHCIVNTVLYGMAWYCIVLYSILLHGITVTVMYGLLWRTGELSCSASSHFGISIISQLKINQPLRKLWALGHPNRHSASLSFMASSNLP